ncbi:hypothetical protein QYF36_007336 [Acer negundo]|nr:hypothetical protein QYF36_007336 [Acer negundo]
MISELTCIDQVFTCKDQVFACKVQEKNAKGSSIFVDQWERCENCGLGKIPGGKSYDVEACCVFVVSVCFVCSMEEHGFESTRIADVLKAKGKGADGSWLWCTMDDLVYDAVKSMTQHNVGSFGCRSQERKIQLRESSLRKLCEIVIQLCEIVMLCLSLCPHLHSPLHRCLQDYIRNITVQGRSSKSTKVGNIMTEENKLITVTPDTKVLIDDRQSH